MTEMVGKRMVIIQPIVWVTNNVIWQHNPFYAWMRWTNTSLMPTYYLRIGTNVSASSLKLVYVGQGTNCLVTVPQKFFINTRLTASNYLGESVNVVKISN